MNLTKMVTNQLETTQLTHTSSLPTKITTGRRLLMVTLEVFPMVNQITNNDDK
jgi:hypothetical protein